MAGGGWRKLPLFWCHRPTYEQQRAICPSFFENPVFPYVGVGLGGGEVLGASKIILDILIQFLALNLTKTIPHNPIFSNLFISAPWVTPRGPLG